MLIKSGRIKLLEPILWWHFPHPAFSGGDESGSDLVDELLAGFEDGVPLVAINYPKQAYCN